MENCTNWFYLCLYIVGAFTLLFIMLLGYNLKWRKDQVELNKRTEVLEKKNGAEQHQIDKLNKKVEQLEKKLQSNSTK